MMFDLRASTWVGKSHEFGFAGPHRLLAARCVTMKNEKFGCLDTLPAHVQCENTVVVGGSVQTSFADSAGCGIPGRLRSTHLQRSAAGPAGAFDIEGMRCTAEAAVGSAAVVGADSGTGPAAEAGGSAEGAVGCDAENAVVAEGETQIRKMNLVEAGEGHRSGSTFLMMIGIIVYFKITTRKFCLTLGGARFINFVELDENITYFHRPDPHATLSFWWTECGLVKPFCSGMLV